MKEKRFSTKEKVALTILVVLMLAVIGVGAYIIINNVNSANERVNNPTNATVTGDTSLLQESTAKSRDNEPEASAKGKSSNTSSKASAENPSDATVIICTGPAGNSSKTTSTPAETTSKTSKNTSSAQSPVPKVVPDKNTSHASKDVCTINGTKCYVGDTITIAVNLKTPKVLENFQGYTQYSGEYLKFESAKANVNGLVNNHKNTIYYNGSNISSGFDFTSGGTLYTAEFRVLKKGATEISNSFEVLTDMKDKAVSPDSCTASVKVYS